MHINKHFIFDFDSTFIQIETYEVLGEISLADHPNKEEAIRKVDELTRLAMEGKVSYYESLTDRMRLIQANKKHIKKAVDIIKTKVTPSFLRNKKFFKENSKNIYIFSGGFREIILPIVVDFGFLEKNVYANTFRFDENDNIIGVDEKNILCRTNGKCELLKKINLPGKIYIIGDGHTDSIAKQGNPNAKFFAFIENIERKSVIEKADYVIKNLDEFFKQIANGT